MRCRFASIAIAVLALPAALSSAHTQSRPVFTPEDLLAVRSFAGGQPYAVSSTGRWIAYVVTDQTDDWNVQEPRPTGHLFVKALGGAPAPPRALTTGAVHGEFPVWSPDGRRLAFVREEQDQGRDAEFVSYANGDHSLSRHSKADALDANGASWSGSTAT